MAREPFPEKGLKIISLESSVGIPIAFSSGFASVHSLSEIPLTSISDTKIKMAQIYGKIEMTRDTASLQPLTKKSYAGTFLIKQYKNIMINNIGTTYIIFDRTSCF
jgi:hypothetical protein